MEEINHFLQFHFLKASLEFFEGYNKDSSDEIGNSNGDNNNNNKIDNNNNDYIEYYYANKSMNWY